MTAAVNAAPLVRFYVLKAFDKTRFPIADIIPFVKYAFRIAVAVFVHNSANVLCRGGYLIRIARVNMPGKKIQRNPFAVPCQCLEKTVQPTVVFMINGRKRRSADFKMRKARFKMLGRNRIKLVKLLCAAAPSGSLPANRQDKGRARSRFPNR